MVGWSVGVEKGQLVAASGCTRSVCGGVQPREKAMTANVRCEKESQGMFDGCRSGGNDEYKQQQRPRTQI